MSDMYNLLATKITKYTLENDLAHESFTLDVRLGTYLDETDEEKQEEINKLISDMGYSMTESYSRFNILCLYIGK